MPRSEIIVGHFDGALFTWQAEYVKKILSKCMKERIYTQPLALADRADAMKIAPHMFTAAGVSFELPARVIHDHIVEGIVDCAALPLEILPLELPFPLALAGVVGRGSGREAFLSRSGEGFRSIAPGSRVGVYAKRQRTQASLMRSDLVYTPVSPDIGMLIGIEGMRSVDAVFYPETDVRRMSYDRSITEIISMDAMLPALRDGIAVVAHRENRAVLDAIAGVIDAASQRIYAIEDAFLRDFNPVYDAPFAGCITITGSEIRFALRAVDEDTLRAFDDEYRIHEPFDAHAFGRDCASRFERKGGRSPLSKHR
ncbi:MAG: hypothetical protein AABZ39_15690 [Spirochaetota bacterium]